MPRHSPCALLSLTSLGSPFELNYMSFFPFEIEFNLPFTEKLIHHSLHCSVFNVQSRNFRCLVGLGGLEPPTSRLSGVRSSLLSYKPIFMQVYALSLFPSPVGGDEENRTPDPLLARQVLSQLSYTPIWY